MPSNGPEQLKEGGELKKGTRELEKSYKKRVKSSDFMIMNEVGARDQPALIASELNRSALADWRTGRLQRRAREMQCIWRRISVQPSGLWAT